MAAVVLTGHGGFDKLEYREDVPVPTIEPGEVLIKVSAAGINNTDINTRIGWYSKAIRAATSEGAAQGFGSIPDCDASWSGVPLAFPRIQGADCCGQIVAVGDGVDPHRVGERVIIRNLIRTYVGRRPFESWTFGSECDGAFAQYTKAPAAEVHHVHCDWSDAELASVPCGYSTAEGMLHRANVGIGEHVVVTGASGNVGAAAIQLARRRGASVTAVVAPEKADDFRRLGADRIVPRDVSLVAALGVKTVDVVIDVVAGPRWGELLDILKVGGRYAVAGAIAGPIVELDVRTVYLKDLSFFGCTFWDDSVFENLVSYVEQGEIRPLVAKTYALADIVSAQKDFLSKKYIGKLVLVPPI
ncbi:MAG: alcohol dehydrogenase [Mesorhizobium sp.]|nr:MAG: alcohol dehydrogenase [Mesorhizobium sp.]